MSDKWIRHLQGLAKLEENAGKKVAFETSAETIQSLQAENERLREIVDSLRNAFGDEALYIEENTRAAPEGKLISELEEAVRNVSTETLRMTLTSLIDRYKSTPPETGSSEDE